MRKKFTLLITVTALLLGSGGGQVWGQAHIGTSTTHANNVNNEFGAGETATITSGNVTWPGTSRPINTPPAAIRVGSATNANGKNIVINSYNSNGYYQDWMYHGVASWTLTANSCSGYPAYPTAPADNAMSYTETHHAGPGTIGPHSYSNYCGVSCSAHTIYDGGKFAPYVTNTTSNDDGVGLVQLIGNNVNSDLSFAATVPARADGAGLTLYKRPTTIAIDGTNTLTEFYIEDNRWWYNTYNVGRKVPEDTHYYSRVCDSQWTDNTCSYSCWCSDCCSGGTSGNCGTCYTTRYYSRNNKDAIRHRISEMEWKVVMHQGSTFLDAAVQIMSGANVCLRNSITDGTTTAGSVGGGTTTGVTDAMVIYPVSGHNFMLRLNGDYNRMQQKHDGNTANLFYTAAGFPTTGDASIFLYPGATTFDWSGYAAGGSTLLTIYDNGQYDDIAFPATTTTAGVLGVYGNYNGSNADLYTNTTTGEAGNNKGVIEVGPSTTGQQKFHVSSGGIIKNFSSACDPYCDPINFITAGNVPSFTIQGTDPLNILNTGACNTASIILANAGVTNIQSAVNNATAAGDLLIQAHGGYADIQTNVAFAPPAAHNNNVAVLSDLSYIKAKDFGYSAAGGADKGHVTVWAQGATVASGGNGGYVSIDGALNTSSTSLASNWQNLHDAVQKNSGNLANFAGCANGEEMFARTTGALNTNMQTRIQSDNDYVRVNGDFTHIGKDGGLFVQGNGNVTVNGATTIDFSAGIGDAVIQSKSANVVLQGAFTYTGNQTTDLFIDGETGVQFNNGSAINYTSGAPSAHIGIQSNAGSIAFSGAAFDFINSSTGNTQIWAGKQITNDINAPLLFAYTKATSGQHIDMYAGDSIVLRGTLTFDHDDATAHTGFIALRAFTNKENLWFGVSGIPGAGVCPERCGDGLLAPTRGNIDLYNTVTIDYEGSENVWMAANHDINVRHDYFHTAGGAANAQTGFTRFVAGNDITTGFGNPGTSFNYTHKGDTGDFDMKAGSDIITHNKANITYTADAKNINTTLFACRNIDIRNAFTYMDDATNLWTRWYANQDILTNSTCLTYGAPVNFTSVEDVKTDWNAGRNIHTADSVKFHYGSTGNTVRDLKLIAQGGNIEIDRYLQVDYDSDNSILFSAEMQGPGQRHNGTNDFGVNRNTIDGNILLNDSFNIYRTNSAVGLTELLAKYNIRTAMVTMDDNQSTGNSTLVESHMGDIFLGYSTAKDNCQSPAQNTLLSYNKNRFLYTVSAQNTTGNLNIKAGYKDNVDNSQRDNGGNVYFTHVDATMGKGGIHPTVISIPFSNEYFCGNGWSLLQLPTLKDFTSSSRMMYEHAGIIGGVGPCGRDDYWSYPYLPGQGKGNSMPSDSAAVDTSLIYFGNHGNLLVDAGTRGNIIINRGTYLNFQEDNGNTEFRTRDGNVDMRYPFNADSLRGSLLFLASSDLPGKLNVTNCECGEEKNNVYLQDFKYNPIVNSGSVFVGADNNIKLQYGGLKSIGTTRDPFFSPNGDKGYPCGSKHHCDADTAENQARDLILNFYQDGTGASIAKGGFAAVASDRIDTYKNMSYNGGSGSGLSSVPKYGSLHGESVAGYGLYIKTQGNKNNWNMTDHDVNNTPNPWVGAACIDDPCSNDFLHNIARVTFHADARIYAENQRVLISSPVLETFGNADYNTDLRKGTKTSILLHADSLIYHDSLIIDGPKTQFTTWSGLYRDMPVIKLGHHRFTPPTAEDGGDCAPCFTHPKDPRSIGDKALDTVFVTFRNDASVKRLHTLVAEHAVVSFLTDSFDHHRGNPTLNAKFYTDTFKIRNHVELFKTPDHTHDGHFELISEEQMSSKDYAGIYARHLHMEPISPSCSDFNFSQLWLQDPMLDVITSSTFGGFGWIHADVHVEIEGNLFPGFASLGTDGNCYEQRAGVLKMKDLRLDKGASVKVTIGDQDAQNSFAENYDCPSTFETLELGRYADCLIVDSLTISGSLEIDLAVRSGLSLAAGESRCFPILQYKSVQEGVLNNIKLKKTKLTSKDHKSIEGTYYLTIDVDTACNVVYVCVATVPNPVLMRDVFIPAKSGITTFPVPGTYHVRSGASFGFNVTYGAEYLREGEQLAVYTGRVFGSNRENIVGIKNANGEYEYVINDIRTNIVLEFGPDYVASDDIEGASVWSHNNMIHIRVDKKDIASIYMITGQMVKQIELSEGTSSVPMEYGVYIVTLKDGSVHKVIVK